MNENTDCVVTVTDLADQHAFTEALASADILTNGTKVGMKPLENESLIGDVSLLRPELLVTEGVYNPHMTKLLQQAQQAGCKTIDGYGMLLWQGAEQFELWTGKSISIGLCEAGDGIHSLTGKIIIATNDNEGYQMKTVTVRESRGWRRRAKDSLCR
ncbi:shikimate 5-dehydrogenase [Salmonella enterica subsp. enterica]|uniref:Shikimate 5-dehydrogenase n=1 Tax=Salmonella enterica I TaxID=59201 RepID=A0A379WAS2_SALET|nr:shikimate 5-dehydrogenase [Salmonella enterica subsp. enterica]